MHPKYLRIEDYTYTLPPGRIAQYPKEERDASKLLIYRDKSIQEDIYRNIAAYIPQRALLVFNQTRVMNVRLLFRKESGATIEVFCLEPDNRYPDMQTAMVQKSEVYWKCLVGGAHKWKKDTVLSIEMPDLVLQAEMVSKEQGASLIRLKWDHADLTFAAVLQQAGQVPLPPYLGRKVAEEDKERYQTVYAREEGSVAAPTAGLHFTPYVFEQLVAQGIDTAFLTLHVGAGTFMPVKAEQLQDHTMHSEWIAIERSMIGQLLSHHEQLVAVGTTSMRTLESLYWIGVKLAKGIPVSWEADAVSQWDPYEIGDTGVDTRSALEHMLRWMDQQGTDRLMTKTQILIAPGYKARMVKYLVTNFHQPGSTLLLLIAAIVGDDWKRIYDHALANDFRFLSYGDGCLLECNR